eukprot:883430-Pelagomonas_calceolata.AAC.4
MHSDTEAGLQKLGPRQDPRQALEDRLNKKVNKNANVTACYPLLPAVLSILHLPTGILLDAENLSTLDMMLQSAHVVRT